MVKKKGKSKRTSLSDKYKIQRKITETHRKRRKQAKKDAASGKVIPKSKKDPGIPNSWPFKHELLSQIQRAKDRQEQKLQEAKQKRQSELRALQDHQKQGGAARTVQELVDQVAADQQAFAAATETDDALMLDSTESTASTQPVGQSSRRAYLTELKKVVDTADVVLQVLDARDPVGTRMKPAIENGSILSHVDKKMVLVLNKIDLVPKSVVSAWLEVLRRSHPTIAIRAGKQSSSVGSNSGADAATKSSTTPVGMDGLLQLLKNYARTGPRQKTTIVCAVVGYPNVGKSSIINALKRSRAVGVSPRPGYTTSMQEVVLDRHVRLLDSPGVVFDDSNAALLNCIDVDAATFDPIPAVQALIRRCDPQSLILTYNIPRFPPDDVMMFLVLVAKSYGRVLKGGIPDKVGAAKAVLKDWNSGKIPYYTMPPATTTAAAAATTTGAKVVQELAAEFDLTKFDAVVLNSLDEDEKDEMDFIKLHDQVAVEEAGTAMVED